MLASLGRAHPHLNLCGTCLEKEGWEACPCLGKIALGRSGQPSGISSTLYGPRWCLSGASSPCSCSVLLSFHRAVSFLPAQVPVANESQSVVQQPFQQPVLVPASQSVQGGLQTGGVPIYYSVIPTAQQNGTR